MVDTTKELRVEANASDYATRAVLSMKDDDGKWHPCAYLSKGLDDVERNYDIHDKELLGVMRALEAWCHYLEGCKHKIEIWTDHQNCHSPYFRSNLPRHISDISDISDDLQPFCLPNN